MAEHDASGASADGVQEGVDCEPSTSGSVPLAETRNRGKQEHGCKHYKRRCMVVAPCCNEVFWCRHCHNEHAEGLPDPKQRHELKRAEVREVVCALCNLRQPIAEHCSGCGVAFGEYACLRCSFFDDDTTKAQFHCEKCGICRVGGRENYFHCNKCGCCYHISLQGNHVCVEDSMRHNCPVCFEFLFDSIRQTAVLKCGHTIHVDCLDDLQRADRYSCPICLKSFLDMSQTWQMFDEDIAATPMPQEYANWRADVWCNDCNLQSNVPFHLLGMKCPACNSYNTRRVAVYRGDQTLLTDDDAGGLPGGGAGGAPGGGAPGGASGDGAGGAPGGGGGGDGGGAQR